MYQNSYTLQLDTKRTVSNVVPTFVQDDTAILNIKVTDNGSNFDLSTADKYTVTFKRPDNVVITGNGTFSSGLLTYQLSTDEMSVPGELEVIAQFYSGTSRISTKPFKVIIIGDIQEGIAPSQATPLIQQLQAEGAFAQAQGEALGYKGVYDATVAYKQNNIISYNNILYMCISATTAGTDPTNPSYWTQMSPMARINSQTWIANSNQTVFTLSNGSYVINSNNIHVTVGGVEQPPSAFTETSPTSFTLSEAVSLNTSVYAWWFEGAVSIFQTHHSTHEAGGQDELDVTKLKNYQQLQSDGDYAYAQGQALGYKGAYDSTLSYKQNNIVSFNNINYICVADASVGIDPTNGIYWTQLSPQSRANSQTWTATTNQTVFTITNGSYTPNSNNIRITVGGVPQTPSSYTETSSTSFTLSEAVSAGTIVFAWWLEGAISISKTHHATHQVGGQDELDVTTLKNYPEQIANKIGNLTNLTTPTKTDLVSAINSNTSSLAEKVQFYTNIQGMVQDSNLKVGATCNTLGYYSAGDYGGASYTIVAAGTGTADGGSFITLNNGLQAKLIVVDSSVDVKQFGAYGDNSHDDTTSFQNALNFTVSNNYRLFIPKGWYIITGTLLLTGNKSTVVIEGVSYQSLIKFQPSTPIPLFGIKNGVTSSDSSIIYNNQQTMVNSSLKNFKVLGNDTNSIFSQFVVWNESTIEHVMITHFYKVFDGGAIMYTSKFNRNDIIFISDSVFSNCRMIDSQFFQNYFSGETHVITTNGQQYGHYPDLMKNGNYFTDCDFIGNWVEFFINVFDQTSKGTRILDNFFDYCVRINNTVVDDCKITGNRFSNFDKTQITTNIQTGSTLIDPNYFNIDFYLITVYSEMDITNNKFMTPNPSPIYKFLDLYGNNVIQDTIIKGNNYVGFSADYTKICFAQAANNPKVTMTNSYIDDGFVITNTAQFAANTFIEHVNFRYGDILLRSTKRNGNVNLFRLDGSGFPGGGTLNYYVDATNGNDSNDGQTSGTALATITKALSVIPKHITDTVTLTIVAGTYNETVTVKGFYGGGMLKLIGDSVVSSTRNVNNIDVEGCSVNLLIQGLNITTTTVNNGIVVNQSSNVSIQYCNNITSQTSGGRGVYATYSNVDLENNTFSNKQRSISADYITSIYSYNNSGSGNSYPISSERGSKVAINGTQPTGTNANYTATGGQVLS